MRTSEGFSERCKARSAAQSAAQKSNVYTTFMLAYRNGHLDPFFTKVAEGSIPYGRLTEKQTAMVAKMLAEKASLLA